jgi:iron complex outermembrane recepter protein
MSVKARILMGAFASVSTAALLGIGLPAMAQDAAAQSSDATEVGEVVVTAQKRAERLTDVPISVVALTGRELVSGGINTTRDLTQVTPGMTAPSTGYALQPAIRGITSQGSNAGEEANVSTYVDDAYMPAQYSGLMQLRDVERVEVLKGPQGTLFGRNSTGGAIRVVTREPSQQRRLEINAGYGFDIKERQVDLYASTGLGETLAASISLFYLRNEGILDNIAPNSPTGDRTGREDDIAGRLKLKFTPNDMFSYTLSLDAGRSRNSAPYALAPRDGNIANLALPGAIDPHDKPFTVSQSTDTDLEVSGYGATGTGVIDFGPVTLKSITAARHTDGSFASDADRTNLPLGASTTNPDLFYTDNFSQEFQLSSDTDGPLRWIGGMFFYDAESVQGFEIWASDPGGVLGSSFAGRVKTQSFAPFGEATYTFNDRFSITGGIRYTHESKDFDYRDLFRSGGLPLRKSADSRTWENVSYRAVAQYKFTPDMNVYASYSTGFKSGVYNSSSFAINVVEPEEIKAIEVGFKGRVSPNLFLTAAAFHYAYDNLQFASYDNSPGILIVRLTNAAKAEVIGLEGNADFRLGQNWSGQVGVSWIPKAEYTDFPGAVVFPRRTDGLPGNTTLAPFDASGTRMIRTPEFTLNAGLTYRTPLWGGDGEAGVNYYYNSGFLFAPGEVNPLAEQDSYNIINARLSWATADGRYKFTVYGENLTNDWYGTYENNNALGDAIGFSRPRVIGVRIGYQY